jgi:hypothetical protein
MRDSRDERSDFFYKAIYGITNLDVHNYVSFVPHNRTRHSNNPNLILQTPCCKTSTYQASYFNRIAKLWNCVCSSTTPDTFSCLRTFKNYLYEHYSNLIFSVFDVNLLCTWSMSRNCPCHRIWRSYVFCIVIYCFVFLFCYL